MSEGNPKPIGELLSTAAVVRRLSISEATIWRLEKKGQFPKAIMISARCKRWRAVDIEDFVNDRAATAR